MNTNLIQLPARNWFMVLPDVAFGQLPPRSPMIAAVVTVSILVAFALNAFHG